MNWKRQTSKGYIYDRRVFIFAFLMVCVAFVAIAYHSKFDFSNKIYFVCENPGGCPNPYKNMECSKQWLYGEKCLIKCTYDWCDYDRLEPGEYGEKPPRLQLLTFYIFIFMIFFFAFIINHEFHNKNKKFHFEMLLNDRQKKFFKKFER